MNQRISMMYAARILFIAISLLWLAGCSSTPEQKEPEIPAMHPVEDVVRPDVNYVVDVYDPWEPMNRRIYNFNTHFDRYVFLPVVRGYEFITPDVVEDSVSNFFSNIGEIENFINSALQLKPRATATAFFRFAMNSTFGVLGLFDPATDLMGTPEWDEDFGQTLGHYGVGDGPFVVLPILGPSNARDTTGLVADGLMFSAIDPLNFDSNDDVEVPYYLLQAIDTRHRTKFRYWETGSPFEYELVRLLYGKYRQLQIAK
jgi:phospholipid-binding lipoprotein MlaA